MNKFLFTIILICLTGVWSKAQQFTFQGKIYNNGSPVNGTATFEFSIGSPISWSETHQNVPVNNGLYAVVLGSKKPLPVNLFDSANNSRNLVVFYNGNAIDTVTIYAPFERDPTVPAYLKKGITWDIIKNKPRIDTTYTLSINGNQLSILHGNTVTLPINNTKPKIDTLTNPTINGKLKVVDTTLRTMLKIPSAGSSNCTGGKDKSIWQSFKAEANGKLREVKLNLAVSGGTYIIVKLYDGAGINTQAILQKTITSGLSGNLSLTILNFTSGVSPVTLENGTTYTIEIVPPVGGSLNVNCISTNPYNDGYSSLGSKTDVVFEVNIDNSAPSLFTFGNNGYVGIGTENPTVQLEVKGRIKDQTGFITPVGSVVSYAGRNIPQGWLLCDGRQVSRSTYPDLFSAIDTVWGNGNGSTTFNLPDMRGMFLRGVDGGTGNDPDASSRIASNSGGNSGNDVGSKQGEETKSHTHTFIGTTSDSESGSGYITSGGSKGAQSINGTGLTSVGGNETRPKNVNVYYIIKY